jgi:hypothetical protein
MHSPRDQRVHCWLSRDQFGLTREFHGFRRLLGFIVDVLPELRR